MTSCIGGVRKDLGDLRKVSELSSCVRTGGWSFVARRGQVSRLRRGPHVSGGVGDGKVSIERMCISLLMSKSLLTQR